MNIPLTHDIKNMFNKISMKDKVYTKLSFYFNYKLNCIHSQL